MTLGKREICGVRENRGAKFHSLVCSKVIAERIDATEKNPLFNLQTVSKAFPIGILGYNFQSKHSENFDIMQHPYGQHSIMP